MNNKIGFNDLSAWLKTLVVLFWIGVGANILIFIIGFLFGFTGY